MRMFLSLITVAAILGGSYVIAFGMPPFVSTMIGNAPDADTAQPQVAGTRSGQRGGGATMVVLTPLEQQPYADILRAVGSAKALRSADVTSKVAGEVTETLLSANREVSRNDVLVQLDARTEALNVEIAQAELDQARDTVQRYEQLQTSGNLTITDVTLTETRVAQRLAEANLGLAQVALDNRTIRAPIAGKLGLSDLDVGDYLPANTIVTTIDNSDVLLIEFELPERSVGILAKEQIVLASTPTFRGRTFEGAIVAFDSRIDDVTRSVTVKARLENPEGMLWPGMTFAVRIIHESDPLAMLPATAITWSRGGSSVWVAHDGTAQQVPATILFRRDDSVWIDADIPVGAMVVTEGAQKLRDGARITTAKGARPAKSRQPAGNEVPS